MSGPFATAEELCEFTGIGLPPDLARLQALLGSASDLIRRFCDQILSRVPADTVVLKPVPRPSILLPQRPVTAVTSVTVAGLPVTDYWFSTSGILYRGTDTGTVGVDWDHGATVIYDHGYFETDPEFNVLRTICIEAAARAYTLNRQPIAGGQGSSEALGSMLMESAGYAPEVFLSEGEKMRLADLGPVGVG